MNKLNKWKKSIKYHIYAINNKIPHIPLKSSCITEYQYNDHIINKNDVGSSRQMHLKTHQFNNHLKIIFVSCCLVSLASTQLAPFMLITSLSLNGTASHQCRVNRKLLTKIMYSLGKILKLEWKINEMHVNCSWDLLKSMKFHIIRNIHGNCESRI